MPMDENQYLYVRNHGRAQQRLFQPHVHMEDQSDRTLLYGYDLDRTTVHVYLQGGEVHVLRFRPVYDDVQRILSVVSHEHGSAMLVESLIPTKRSYPESCDFEFTLWLKNNGFDPNFTKYGHRWTGGPDIDRPRPYAPFEGYYVGATVDPKAS